MSAVRSWSTSFRAARADAAAARDEARAKKLLLAKGVTSLVIVTATMARLLRMAKSDLDEADRIIDECPAQAQTDETWTG